MSKEQRFMDFFTQLTAENLHQITSIFARDAHFKDPFNDVYGMDAIKTVFTHMFATTVQPKFTITSSASNEQNQLFIEWKFTFTKSGKAWNIDGCSRVTFNTQDQVEEHIDYWDPAEQIYSKIGLLKPIFNFLRAKLKAS